MLLMAGCTKETNPVYLPDPADAADTSPLVTVIYDPGALGDLSYNDLLYAGVERAAVQKGLRTRQLSPRSKEEGLRYISGVFNQMSSPADTTRQLLIVTGSSYDDFLRANNRRLEANPNAELLYFETTRPLEGKGSSIHIAFYGAMYEAGALSRFFSSQALMAVANPQDNSLTEAAAGFRAGFEAHYFEDLYDVPYGGQDLFLEYLADEAGEGFVIDDVSAIDLIYRQPWEDPGIIVPLCGGAGAVFRRLAEYTGSFKVVEVDRVIPSTASNIAAVKNVDTAVERCIGQWLSEEGLPKHQDLGLADGCTEMVICPPGRELRESLEDMFPREMREALHRDALEKEAVYAGQ